MAKVNNRSSNGSAAKTTKELHMDKLKKHYSIIVKNLLNKLPRIGKTAEDPICYYLAIDETFDNDGRHPINYFFCHEIDKDGDYSVQGIQITDGRYIEFFDYNPLCLEGMQLDLLYEPQSLSSVLESVKKKLANKTIQEVIE